MSKLEMADVVRAHMDIPGCPILTSNQCHALAVKLNAVLEDEPTFPTAWALVNSQGEVVDVTLMWGVAKHWPGQVTGLYAPVGKRK